MQRKQLTNKLQRVELVLKHKSKNELRELGKFKHYHEQRAAQGRAAEREWVEYLTR